MVARVVATAYGGPEVLAVVDEDIGGPGPGEVLVEIRAAATNPIDYKLYSGALGRDPGALPMPLGYEASGKPPNVSFEEASDLMLTGGTAVHALTAMGVTEGDTLLLHGASGGVGLMAPSTCRWRWGPTPAWRSGTRPACSWPVRPRRAWSRSTWRPAIRSPTRRRPIGNSPRGTATARSSSFPERRHRGTQLMWMPEMARLMTSRWTSEVPSKMV